MSTEPLSESSGILTTDCCTGFFCLFKSAFITSGLTLEMFLLIVRGHGHCTKKRAEMYFSPHRLRLVYDSSTDQVVQREADFNQRAC
jgi:hypothetical protein